MSKNKTKDCKPEINMSFEQAMQRFIAVDKKKVEVNIKNKKAKNDGKHRHNKTV